MSYLHSDLGQLPRGSRVRFTLSGNQANVLLLDSANYSAYRAGRRAQCIGGLARRSPAVLEVPRAGRWHAVVDVSGGGRVRAGIEVLAA